MLKPGLFRHYKGGYYILLGIAETHEHNGDRDCIYVSLTSARLVTRPLTRDSRNADSWLDIVEWPDGYRRTRFIEIDAAIAADLVKPLEDMAKMGPPDVPPKGGE